MKAIFVYYYVKDLDRAVRFYTEVLKLSLRFRDNGRWAEVDAGPISIGLHPTKKGQQVIGGGGGTVTLQVKNLEDLMGQLSSRGATVGEFEEGERGKFAMVTDPDGNKINLVEWSPEFLRKTGYYTE